MTPIDLDAVRRERQAPEYDGLLCGECGGAWFTVQAVVLNVDDLREVKLVPAEPDDSEHW